MSNFDKVLSMVRNEDEAISAWNKIPASKKGYNPSVNKIISLICEQITSETIRKYDEKYLTPCELDQIESILEECYPDGMDETAINDFFWFEEDTIAEWLGYDSFEDIIKEQDGEEE